MAVSRDKSSRNPSRRETDNFPTKIYNLSDDLICIADIDGYLKKINPAFEKCLGYSPDEMLNKSFFDFVHPDDIQRTKAVIRNKLEHGIPVFNFENRYRCKDGTYKWLSWTSNPVVEERIVYAIARDVTERKTAEQKIKDSEKRYQQLFETESDAIFLIDLETGRFLETNQAASDIYGYTHDELMTKRHIDLSAEPEETLRAMTNTPKTIPVRYHRKKDGTVFPVEITTNHIVYDGRRVLLCAVRDITERKQIEAAWKKSESKYRSLFSEMQNGFSLNEIICDEKGNPVDYVTLEVNQAFESLLGQTPESVLNKKVSNFLSKSELDHWLGIFGPVALTGKSASYEMYSPSNNRYFEGITYSPEKGKFAVVFQDVTEQKKAEVELQQAHEDLEVAQRLTKIGSWKWTIATNKVTWSKELCHILGWDPQKPPPPFNEEMSSFYSPDSWKKLNEVVAKALSNGQPYDLETTEIKTDGTVIITNTRGEVDYGPDGKITGLHGTVQDIMERKHLQEQLIAQDRLVS
ncbi:MAG: PAS domain S-box protein, partial [Dehalococcoidales bacterium]|nr:PAS domain S-box protein [Dehalococcoidales bacterium]